MAAHDVPTLAATAMPTHEGHLLPDTNHASVRTHPVKYKFTMPGCTSLRNIGVWGVGRVVLGVLTGFGSFGGVLAVLG